MERESWEKVKEIFGRAMEIAPNARAQYLDNACDTDPVLRQEVDELLRSFDDAGEFLEQPAVREVAQEIVGTSSKLEPGQRLLHYEIVRPLGEGGMGEVYLADDKKLGRKVAVKVLPSSVVEDEDANKRLLREARSAARLEHPNICTIYEIAEDDGRTFIVMQYVEGEDLAHKINAEKLDETAKISIAIQVADALAEAHAAGIIHRDIKPANIIITEKGRAKVLDFGLARNTDTGNSDDERSGSARFLSKSGEIMGTVPYMSPEQVKGEPLDSRTDIFSFGAMLCEMFGVQPFHRKSNAETIAAVLNYDPPMDELPAELRPVLKRCLAKDKAGRYQSADELASGLRGLSMSSGPITSSLRKYPRQRVANTAGGDRNKNSAEIVIDTGEIALPLSPIYKAIAIISIVMVLLAIGGAGYYYLKAKRPPVTIAEKRLIDSLAVLPFENSNSETEYLSDGIAESLINSLSNLPNLRVISRVTAFGFKDKNVTTQQIGRDLNVRAVLTGKFSQVGDLVTIQAELVDLDDNSQLWGDRFNIKNSELLQVQEQIARQITDRLQLKLDSRQKEQIAKHHTDNPEAYREYLKGRFYSLQYTADSHKRALEHLGKAIEIDPTYALAYAGVADAYTTASDGLLSPREALTKAKAAARKGLDLDDKLAEAWAAHGHARLHEWDKSAIDDLNKAIELSPNALTTQLWLGEYYLIWDVQRSVEVLQKASEIDPLSPLPPSFLSFAYLMLRQPERSIEYAKKAIDLGPTFYTEHSYLARFYAFSGDYRSATNELGKIPPEATDVFVLSTRGCIFALQNKRAEAEKVIAEMKKLSEGQYVSPVEFAFVYNLLGDRDKTFLYLEKAFDDRSENLSFIRSLPDYDRIRDDPRYVDLIRRMGF
jgi:eukaryotic-like serine/threonine-protein kinase